MEVKRRLRILLWAEGILAALNLLLIASAVSLVAGAVIFALLWGIHRGKYVLVTVLSVFSLLYAAVNLIVLLTALLVPSGASPSALIWLGADTALLALLGALLLSRSIRSYLKTLPAPEKKESRFHFFHGGWRDL